MSANPGWLVEWAGEQAIDVTRVGLEADGEALGTPVLGVELLYDGALIPGWYDLAFSNVVASGTATCTVTPPSTNYARHAGRQKLVPLDGTPVPGVIDGALVQFNPSSGFLPNWWVRLHLGSYLGTYLAGNPTGQLIDWRQGFPAGRPVADGPGPGLVPGQPAGSPSWIGRWKLTNFTTKTSHNTFALKMPHAVLVRTEGAGLRYAQNTGPDIVEKIAYAITFASLEAGSPDTVNMLVDGALIASGVVDLEDTSVPPSSSAGLKVGRRYRADVGPLKGLEFEIDPAVTIDDECLLYVIDPRYGQLAADAGGVAVARPNDGVEDGSLWSASPLGLTSSAEYPREVPDGSSIYVQERLVIPAGAAFDLNPLPLGFYIQSGLAKPATFGGVTMA